MGKQWTLQRSSSSEMTIQLVSKLTMCESMLRFQRFSNQVPDSLNSVLYAGSGFLDRLFPGHRPGPLGVHPDLACHFCFRVYKPEAEVLESRQVGTSAASRAPSIQQWRPQRRRSPGGDCQAAATSTRFAAQFPGWLCPPGQREDKASCFLLCLVGRMQPFRKVVC